MFWKKFDEQTRTLAYSLFVMALVSGALIWAGTSGTTEAVAAAASTATATTMVAPAAVFNANAPSLGAIPDGPGTPTACGADGAPRDVTFTVAGMSAPLTNVELSMTFGGPVHSWRGDVSAYLIAPNATQFTLYRYIGSTTAGGCGSANDLAGPYNFKDSAAGTNIWTVATTPTPAGDYRTTAAGGAGQVNPAPVTNLTAAFAGLTTPQINGTWTLRVTDGGAGDTGAVSAASLTLVGAAVTAQHVVDYNGDGRTDASVVRNTGGGPGGQVTWFNCYTGVAEPACWQFVSWGIATDFFVPVDYDGDLKTDIAVWRAGTPGSAAYYILQSQTNTLRQDNFGQTGDDPTVAGDYTGDGKADTAVYRAGATAGAQSFWYFRNSSILGGFPVGTVFSAQWGQNGDFVAPGDYDGNGRADLCVQRNAGGGQASFWLYLSGPGTISNTVFGTPTDVIVPGDYDGDGKTDIATIRGSAGQINWFYKPSTAPAEAFRFLGAFGNSATDFPTQGDYDGDGTTDVAIYRPNADPTMCNFWIRNSNGGAVTYREWGQNGDYPVANYNSH